MKKKDIVFIEGERIKLRPLFKKEFNAEYLSWLNDPEVNRYSNRRSAPTTEGSMNAYTAHYRRNPKKGVVLAIVVKKGNVHIGNIALTDIDPIHRCAEISILIGKKKYHGKGYAAEAIHELTKHAFLNMNLNKVYAGSINPAFTKCVKKLGWKKEGCLKERMWSGGKYHDVICTSILRREFKICR